MARAFQSVRNVQSLQDPVRHSAVQLCTGRVGFATGRASTTSSVRSYAGDNLPYWWHSVRRLDIDPNVPAAGRQ